MIFSKLDSVDSKSVYTLAQVLAFVDEETKQSQPVITLQSRLSVSELLTSIFFFKNVC